MEKRGAADENRLRYLDVQTQVSDLLSAPTIPGQKLEVLLDGIPIQKLTRVAVTIYNSSDKDYENLPVFIELTPRGEQGAFEVVGQDVVGANNLPEAVTDIEEVEASEVAGGSRFGYLVTTLNRASEDSTTPAFVANYLLQGPAPQVEVKTNKIGLELRDVSVFRGVRAPEQFYLWISLSYFGLVLLVAWLAWYRFRLDRGR